MRSRVQRSGWRRERLAALIDGGDAAGAVECHKAVCCVSVCVRGGVVDVAAVRRVQRLCETSRVLSLVQNELRRARKAIVGMPIVSVDALRDILAKAHGHLSSAHTGALIAPLCASGMVLLVKGDSEAVVSPVQWMANRLGDLFDPHARVELRFVQHGVVDVVSSERHASINGKDFVGRVGGAVGRVGGAEDRCVVGRGEEAAIVGAGAVAATIQ